MRADSLHRLQELLDEVKRIDDKILGVDIRIDKIFHVSEEFGISVPRSTKHRVVVEGCE